MELKEGMYVRTLTFSGFSRIGKLKKIDDICITDNGVVDKKQIIKTSHNIIDLIEVGDYVNGLIVNDIVTDIDGTKTFNLFKQSSYFGNEDIKSIVTKQQFENMQYVID